MNIAIIDLGTNTFNLLIVAVKGNKYETLLNSKVAVKLGEGAIAKGFIAPDAFQRGMDAIAIHMKNAARYDVKEFHAYATSGIRSTSNGEKFIKEIHDRFGLSIKIISGDQEAAYIYYGVRQVVPMTDKPDLIMDIGGGSTEFIIANKEEIFWKQSFLLGVSRLKEIFQPSDPISISDQQKIIGYLDQELSPLLKALQNFSVQRLLGSSGSFETFAELIVHKFNQPEEVSLTADFEIKLSDFETIHEELLKSTVDERLLMKGMIPMRVDMIVLSSILTNWVINNCRIEKMIISSYSMKEGVLWKILNH